MNKPAVRATATLGGGLGGVATLVYTNIMVGQEAFWSWAGIGAGAFVIMFFVGWILTATWDSLYSHYKAVEEAGGKEIYRKQKRIASEFKRNYYHNRGYNPDKFQIDNHVQQKMKEL